MDSRARRLHICLGADCNNNCLFCMEEDRTARKTRLSRIDTSTARKILAESPTREEIMFTAGEPTLRADLPDLIGYAATLGYGRIGMITNGRRLSYEGYARKLVGAGLNYVLVSIHGHTARLHDGQTRTPGSFEQTVAGMANLVRISNAAPGTLKFVCTTVLNRRNMAGVADHVRFLRTFRPDEIVFNAVQPLGRGARHFARLVPTYGELVSRFGAALESLGGDLSDLFLLDVPRCMTRGLPPEVLGFVEEHAHFEPEEEVLAGLQGESGTMETAVSKSRLSLVDKSQLDGVLRVKGPDCPRCVFFDTCEGVWRVYVDEYGLDEFRPVRADSGECR
jgi:MoaA/NifB/PqqE/SkfB family radical SAM enzyme